MPHVETTQIPTEISRAEFGAAPRIGLVTPYDGGNLGDAAIQDAMILNLRQRIPAAQFFGITLDCDNFLRQHGEGAFPLIAASMPLSKGSRKGMGELPKGKGKPNAGYFGGKAWTSVIRRALRRVPGLVPFLKRYGTGVTTIRREIRHSFEGYRVLRGQNLLVISGGGQLDDEYGGRGTSLSPSANGSYWPAWHEYHASWRVSAPACSDRLPHAGSSR